MTPGKRTKTVQKNLLLMALLLVMLFWNDYVMYHVAASLPSIQKTKHLPSLSINPNTVTVSGISSGGFMAHQFQLSHSSRIMGAGIVAGGPFYCAAGNVATALGPCMKYPRLISTSVLEAFAMEAELGGQIDPLSHLKKHRVFVYSGTKDTVVAPGVVGKLVELYEALGGVARLHVEMNEPSEHAWITQGWGNACDYLGAPYINACNYPMTEVMLKTLFDDSIVVPSASFRNDTDFFYDNLLEFDQDLYTFTFSEMNSKGFVYIPTACKNGASECHLHINFHGCHQSYDDVRLDYVLHNELTAFAEKNNIIVLYPQTRVSLLNPKSCWDWWGYTSPVYYSKLGFQTKSVVGMMNALMGI